MTGNFWRYRYINGMDGGNGFMGICSSPNSWHCIHELRIPLVGQSYPNKAIFFKRLCCYKLQKRSCPFIPKYALELISVEGISRSKWINLVTNASVVSHIPSQGTCWRDFIKPFLNSCYGQGYEDLVYQMQLHALSFSCFSHFLRQVQRAGSWVRGVPWILISLPKIGL